MQQKELLVDFAKHTKTKNQSEGRTPMTTSSLFGNYIKSINIISMILLQKNYEKRKEKKRTVN